MLVVTVLAALFALPAAKPALPVHYVPAMSERVIQSIYRDRERAEAWLRDDRESFLAAVGRHEFEGNSTLTVGRAADNDIQLDDPAIQRHHLRITVEGDSFHVATLDDSARVRVEQEYEVRDTTLGPSSIALGSIGKLYGRWTLRLSQQHDPAIIVFDGLSQRFKSDYHGLKHYPVDLGYRYTLALTPNPHPDPLRIASTHGHGRPALRVGWFDFMVGRTRCRLTALRLLEPGMPSGSLLVLFRDATSGKETTPLGRILDVPRMGASSNYLLDFNNATNPACAFSEFYNCPLPPRENTLKIPIPAGEKDLHYVTAKR